MTPFIIAVGGSLGSLKVLQAVLPVLPASLKAAVVMVVHREQRQADLLTGLLQAYSIMPVEEIEDKLMIEPGHRYVAPADYHVLIQDGSFALSVEGPVCYARPSMDVCFESVAERYGARAIGVLLTGMGRDGVEGLAAIKRRGGLTVAQDPASAEAPALPQASIDAGAADHVVPLAELGAFLVKAASGG